MHRFNRFAPYRILGCIDKKFMRLSFHPHYGAILRKWNVALAVGLSMLWLAFSSAALSLSTAEFSLV